ncbi:MAG: hypothetical protein ACKON7_03365 [Planctomycetaceae bacterium]
MTAPHRIRLQSAWHATADGAVWSRSFGMPTGVNAGDRIWLEITRPAAGAAVLNGRPLPPVVAGAAAWRHDVTADLRDRNELRLEFVAALPARAADREPLPEAAGGVALVITAGTDDAGALDTRSP